MTGKTDYAPGTEVGCGQRIHRTAASSVFWHAAGGKNVRKAPCYLPIPLVVIAAMGWSACPVQAQAEWDVSIFGSVVTFPPDIAHYEFTCAPGGLATTSCVPATFPVGSDEWWWTCGAFLQSPFGCGHATSIEDAYIRVRGIGSSTISVELRAIAYDDYDCCCAGCSADGWFCPVTIPVAHALSFTTPTAAPLFLEVNVPGVPDGEEVEVSCHYSYNKRARPEGPIGASGGGGGNLAAALGTLAVMDPTTGMPLSLVDASTHVWDFPGTFEGGGVISFTATTGDAITVILSAYVDAWALEPPAGDDCIFHWQENPEHDTASAGVDLRLTCTIDDGGGVVLEACCFSDGSCEDLPPVICVDLEGTPQGPGTTCATVVCTAPLPLDQACCFTSPEDCADLPPDVCTSAGGTPQGPGTDCESRVCFTDACCLPGGLCLEMSLPDCASAGGVSMGPDTICTAGLCPTSPPQMCCLPDDCIDMAPELCTSRFGLPMGPGTSCFGTAVCPMPQACCFSDGTCDDRYPPYCGPMGGTLMGPGSSCDAIGACPGPPQACCVPDGSCVMVPPPDCVAVFGGTPMGAAATCGSVFCPEPPPPRQACCLPDGGCVRAPVDGCGDLSGISMGAGTSCETLVCSSTSPPIPVADPTGISKTRFVSFSVPGSSVAAGAGTALRVRLVSLHHVMPPYSGGPSVPFTSFEGQVRWVGPPAQYLESASSGITFFAAQLQCAPYYHDWSTVGLLHVTGSAIVPSSVYEVENVAASCMGAEAACTAVSSALSISTTRWADVQTPYNPPSTTAQPDVGDISAMVNKFRSAAGALIKARALLIGTDQFGSINIGPDLSFGHIAACVDAFRGRPYPYTISSCP